MKKLDSYKQFEIGKIYNRVYVGDNEAYTKINGKETFIVVAISPELKTQVFFGQYGSVSTDELKANPTTFPVPKKAFEEYKLYEVEDKSEWFIKSQYMTLEGALNEGLITLSEVKQIADLKILTCIYPAYYYRYSVENKSRTNQYLQSIFVKWDSREDIKSDFARYGCTLK